MDVKLKLATRLEMDKPSATTQKLLLSQSEAKGPVWSKLVLEKVENEYANVSKIKFYGARSKTLFKRRTQAIDKFVSLAKPILDGADLETRVYILHMLKMTYKTMANEILNTPIPDGLDEQTMGMVANQISTMADPFDRVNEDYDKLLNDQLTAMTDADLKIRVAANLNPDVMKFSDFIVVNKEERKDLMALDYSPAIDLKKKLLEQPENRQTLADLKDFYSKNESLRLAAYYSGRIDNLKQVE